MIDALAKRALGSAPRTLRSRTACALASYREPCLGEALQCGYTRKSIGSPVSCFNVATKNSFFTDPEKPAPAPDVKIVYSDRKIAEDFCLRGSPAKSLG